MLKLFDFAVQIILESCIYMYTYYYSGLYNIIHPRAVLKSPLFTLRNSSVSPHVSIKE